MESNLYFLHPEVVTFTETAVNVDNAALKISKQTEQNPFKLNLLQSNLVDLNSEGTENLFKLAGVRTSGGPFNWRYSARYRY